MLDGHFVLEHGSALARGRLPSTSMAQRACGVARTIGSAGGWQQRHSPKTRTQLSRPVVGWQFKYLQDVECSAELPIEMTAFKPSRHAGPRDSSRLARRFFSRPQEQAALAHQARGVVPPNRQPQLSPDDRPERPADARHDHPQRAGPAQMLLIDLPLFMASTMSISSFYLVSQKELFPDLVQNLLYLPFLMALGVGLTITNTKAVMEALLG